MNTFFDKLRKLVGLNQKVEAETAVSPPTTPFFFTDTAVADLMRQVDKTETDQYSCEETFALLDEYVELVQSEEDAATLMPLVEHHLIHCPGCREHYEILLTILQTE